VGTFPRGEPGDELLEGLCAVARGEPRIGCFREAIERRATAESRQELVESLLDAAEGGQPPCAGTGVGACLGEVERHAEKLPATDFRTSYAKARLLAMRRDIRGASRLVLEACPAVTDATSCVQRGLEWALAARDLEMAGRLAERYVSLRCGDRQDCAQANERVAAGYAGIQAWGMALKYAVASAKAEPTAERWIRNAEVALESGSLIATRVALERARKEGGLSDELSRRATAVEARIESFGR
jgi:hypothetical protein